MPATLPAGIIGITDEHRAEIQTVIREWWHIVHVAHTPTRLTFHVSPNARISLNGRRDAETELSQRFGNAPYIFATDFSFYRLTFIANR